MVSCRLSRFFTFFNRINVSSWLCDEHTEDRGRVEGSRSWYHVLYTNMGFRGAVKKPTTCLEEVAGNVYIMVCEVIEAHLQEVEYHARRADLKLD